MSVTELFFLTLIIHVNFLKAAIDVKADTNLCTIKYTEQPPSELSCNPYLLYLDPPQVYLRYACNAESNVPIQGFTLTWFRIYPDQRGIEEIGCPGHHINTSTRQRCILDLIGDISPAAYFCQARHMVNGSYESLMRSNIAYVHQYSVYSGSLCAGTNSVMIEMCADNNSTEAISTSEPIVEENEETSIDIHRSSSILNHTKTYSLQSTVDSTYTLPYTVQSTNTNHVTNTITTTYTVQSISTSHVTNTITTTYTVQSISTSHVTNTITTTDAVSQTNIPEVNCSTKASFLLIAVVCTFGLLGFGILVILLFVLCVVIHHYRQRFRNFEENREKQEAVISRNEIFEKSYNSTSTDKYDYVSIPSHHDTDKYDYLTAVSVCSYYDTDRYNYPSKIPMPSHHITDKYDYPTEISVRSYRDTDIQLFTEMYALPESSNQQSKDATYESYQSLHTSGMEYTNIYTLPDQQNSTEYENTKQL